MKIGPFEILSTLGSGGSGIVYRARRETLPGRIVALKQLNSQVKEGDRIFERFTREAQLMASIQSEHVVTLYSYEIVDGRPLLEMECLEGGSLEQQMAAGPMDLASVLGIVGDILRGLKALHSAGVVHRDVKPANVLRDNEGRYKLSDFGLSAAESEIKTTFESATIRWVAPESVGQPPRFDFRSDLYAVGMIAYEAILGPDGFHNAFPDLTPVAAFGEKWIGWLKNAAEEATPLHVLQPDVPGAISLFMARLMSKDPDGRFASADAALEALEPLLPLAAAASQRTAEQRPREHVHAVRRRPAAAAAATAVEPEVTTARPKKKSPALKYAGIGLGSVAAAVGAIVLGAYLNPQEERKPAPEGQKPAESAAQTQTTTTDAPRLVARIVDPLEAPLSDVEVTLRPGNLRATRNESGEYVVERLSPQTYEMTAEKQGYEVAVQPVTIKAGILHEVVTLQPKSGTPEAKLVAAGLRRPRPTSAGGGTESTPEGGPGYLAGRPGSMAGGSGSGGGAPGAKVTLAGEKPGSLSGTSTSSKPGSRPRPQPVNCPSNPNRARDLFYCPEDEGGPVAVSAVAGVHYRVLQLLDDGREVTVRGDKIFRTGDRVRFAFESNIDGYLYVVQKGSSGRWTMLFPNPKINGGINSIRAFSQYFVPNSDWFTFDQNPGTESIFVFLSKEPVKDLPGFGQPVTHVEMVAQARIDQLQRSVRTRDLVLETAPTTTPASGGEDISGTFVVNSNEQGDAVVATLELIHR